MQLKELEKGIIKTEDEYGKENGFEIDDDFAVLKLYEEVGEFAQAILIHRRKSRPEKFISEEHSRKQLADELADIFGLVVINANRLGIDLEDAVYRKWILKEWDKSKK